MLKTELQNVWDTFIERVDNMFLVGRELPLCLHRSAVDVLIRKIHTWKEEIDNYEKSSTSISKSHNDESVTYVPESEGVNAVKYELDVVGEEFNNLDSQVHSSNATEDISVLMMCFADDDASHSQVNPAHNEKDQDHPDVSVKNGVNVNTFTSLVEMSGDEESVPRVKDTPKRAGRPQRVSTRSKESNKKKENIEIQTNICQSTRSKTSHIQGCDRLTDEPDIPLSTETETEQDQLNNQRTESNTELAAHSDNEDPPELPDTFDDVDSDSHPNDVEENVNGITNTQPDITQSENTKSDLNLTELKKIRKKREKSDKQKIKRRVGRPRKEKRSSAENDPDFSEKRVVKKRKIIGTAGRKKKEKTLEGEESKEKKEPKVKRPVGRPRLETSGIELVKTAFCDICSKGFTNEKGLRKHKESHVNGPCTCPVCGNTYQSKSGYDAHMMKHNNAFQCPHCDYTTGVKTWLDKHIQQVHMKDDPLSRTFLCDICAFASVTYNALKRHRLTHSREKIFRCDQCVFVTHGPEILRAHIRNMHEERPLYECKICHDKFKNKKACLLHEKRHYSEKPAKCPECDFRAVSKAALWNHKRTHKDRSHQCDICKKMFTTKEHMTRHRITHTGEKPFACTFCSYRCNVKANLKKHLKSVHNHETTRECKRVQVFNKDCPKNQCDDESEEASTILDESEIVTEALSHQS